MGWNAPHTGGDVGADGGTERNELCYRRCSRVMGESGGTLGVFDSRGGLGSLEVGLLVLEELNTFWFHHSRVTSF